MRIVLRRDGFYGFGQFVLGILQEVQTLSFSPSAKPKHNTEYQLNTRISSKPRITFCRRADLAVPGNPTSRPYNTTVTGRDGSNFLTMTIPDAIAIPRDDSLSHKSTTLALSTTYYATY